MARFRRSVLARPSGAVVVAVVAAVVLASCSSGSSSSKPASSARRPSGAPITLGVICSCTGPLASSFVVSDAAPIAWQDAINAAGGLAGHPVRVIEKDDQSNPSLSVTAAEQLVEADHAVAIIDNTNLDAGWSPFVQAHHIPVLGVSYPSPAMASNPYWFPTGVTEGYLDDEVVLAAKKVGASNLGVFYCAEQAICAEEMAPLRATAARLGVPVVYAAAISASAPNYTAQCLAAEHAGAKALFIADAVTVDLSAAASCLQQGYRPTEIAVDGAVALSFETAPAMQGLIAAQPDVPFFVDNTPATREMHAAMARYEPAALSSPNYTEEVTQAWIAAKLFQAAVLAAAGPSGRLATVTPAEVLAGLYALHGTTLGGMAPPLTFVRGQPHTIGCWFWMRVQSDRFTTPYGLSPVCAPSSS